MGQKRISFLIVFFVIGLGSIGANADDIPGFKIHIIKPGDTFSRLAPQEHWGLIKKVNGFDEYHLVLGKKIYLPVNFDLAVRYCPIEDRIDRYKDLPRIVFFNLELQIFGAYEFGELARWGPISSGKKGHETPKGTFFVNWKSADYVSKKYGKPMPFAVNFQNEMGLFFHQQAMKGKPASHGCIRLLMEDAEWLYFWVRTGNMLVIT